MLVLTRQDMIGRLSTVTVAPITSTVRGVPSEVVDAMLFALGSGGVAT